ncbi:MAG TPA: tubulin-like doman-containing protein [Terriglobales bacterium]|jgi:hypothetical protein|nr:tubulin-like doman-containing protein [Terriglobales bacterium]
MTHSHLILGLGGTGGKILRSLRKTIYENFQNEDPACVNVRYLYIDSSNEMMAADDPAWKIAGHSVQLSKTSQLKISGADLASASVLENLDRYPGITPWIGNGAVSLNLLNSTDAAGISSGQKRRVGRLLFACRVAQFREQVQALVKEIEVGGTASVTFHVCCSLAGGTGSGSVVDAVSQIRMLYPGQNYRILIYAFLPERAPGANRAGANYHANGYAALMELNALSIGALRPHDLSGEKQDRLELQDPFNGCYLFSDENENHDKVDADKDVPGLVAAFLYQKIIAVKDMVWDSLRRQESFENMDCGPEQSPFNNNPERSRRFFTFGIKQITYPEREIHEYLTYTFARQAILQFQFNRWSDAQGYCEDRGNRSFSDFVRLKETQQKWYLTDEHLNLSEGILPDEIRNKRWKPINAFWLDLIANFETHVRESFPSDDRLWLDELSKLCETAYSENYRDLGVRRFYESKRGEMQNHLRELRGRIEKDLFQEWMTGQKSVYDISRLLAALLASLEERQKQMEEKIARHRQMVEATTVSTASNAAEWSRLGVVSGWLGKRQNLLNEQGECLRQLYIYRTRLEGLGFAKNLLEALIADLALLAADVSRCAAMMVEAGKDFSARVAERCADSGQADLQKPVVRFYKPGAVKELARALIRDRIEQQKHSATVRAALAPLLGENQNFASFNLRISKEKFTSVLESMSARNATAAHDNYAATHTDRAPMLQVSLMERFRREYDANPEALHDYVNDVVSQTRNYLYFNEAEVSRHGPGAFEGSELASYLSIILPEAPDLADFRELLRTELRNAAPVAHDEVTSKGKADVITLVKITNLFPIRFVQQAEFLREQYLQRIMASDSAQARMELHLEGDGSALPNLYVGDVEPKKFLAYLMIGRAMQVVQTLEDPDTGMKNLYLISKNGNGHENPVPLGRDINDAVGESNVLTFDALVSTIQPLLKNEYLHIQKREALSASVQAQIDEIKAKRKNPLDKVYRMFYKAGEAAVVLLGTRQ